jgi:RNA polymerase sigma-70 factor (ECF subfamily)
MADSAQLNIPTSETLLRDLKNNADSPRNDEFASIYHPLIERYVKRQSRRFRLDHYDEDDIIQEVFVNIRRALSRFTYDKGKGGFRAYIRTTVKNQILQLCMRRNRERALPPTSPVFETGGLDPPGDGDPSEDETLMLKAWSLALSEVFAKNGFTPNNKAAFLRMAVDGASPKDVAAEFRLKPNAVYQLKHRVLNAVSARINGALRELPDGEDSLERLCQVLEAGRR